MVQFPLQQLSGWARKHPGYLELGIFVWLCLVGFLWIGAQPLEAWDESRFGENALWQLRTGDPINAYYAGELDTWNVKPPLARWMIALGYLLFGENILGLRFFSALAVVISSWLFFRWIREEAGHRIAVPAIMVIGSCSAWFGYHVGYTGDADAFLLIGLLISAMYGYRYLHSPTWTNGLMAVIGIGIGFWSKSFLAYLFVPGMLIWAALSPDRRNSLLQPRSLLLAVSSFLWPLLWYLLVKQFGQEFPPNEFLGTNAWDTMIRYDFLARATQGSLEGAGIQSTVLSSLDVRMGPWFYVSLLGICFWAIGTEVKKSFWTFSACLLGTVTLLFGFSSTYLNWYLVPVLGFYALFAAYAIVWLCRKHVTFLYVFGAMWIGLQSWKFYARSAESTSGRATLETMLGQMEPITPIQLIQYAPQDLQLMADWASEQVIRRFEPIDLSEVLNSGGVIIGKVDDPLTELLRKNEYQEFSFGEGVTVWRKEQN